MPADNAQACRPGASPIVYEPSSSPKRCSVDGARPPQEGRLAAEAYARLTTTVTAVRRLAARSGRPRASRRICWPQATAHERAPGETAPAPRVRSKLLTGSPCLDGSGRVVVLMLTRVASSILGSG